jgi:hypothetical protein
MMPSARIGAAGVDPHQYGPSQRPQLFKGMGQCFARGLLRPRADGIFQIEDERARTSLVGLLQVTLF